MTVSAAEDADNSVDEEVTLAHTAESGDDDYDIGEDDAVDVVVTAVDDDVESAAVTILSTGDDPQALTALTMAEGDETEYTILLAEEPSADVTVTITAEDGLSLDPMELTFTPDNFGDEQTVTVTADEDDDAVSPTEPIALSHKMDGGGYGDVVIDDINVTVADDDTAGILISATRMEIREGASASYTIRLTAQPAVDPVSVGVEIDRDGAVFANPTSVTFTMDNWEQPQRSVSSYTPGHG